MKNESTNDHIREAINDSNTDYLSQRTKKRKL